MFENSIAKNIVRRHFFEYVEIISRLPSQRRAKVFKSLFTIFLPGPQGLELPMYLKAGVPKDCILGVEKDPKVFKFIKEKNWGINLYCGTFSQLLKDIARLSRTGVISKRFHLVPGSLRDSMIEYRGLSFVIGNLDFFSDMGTIETSAEGAVFNLMNGGGLLSLTCQASRDSMSPDVTFPFLLALIERCPESVHVFRTAIEQLYKYSGSYEKANRIFLREVGFFMMTITSILDRSSKEVSSQAVDEHMFSEPMSKELQDVVIQIGQKYYGNQISSLEDVQLAFRQKPFFDVKIDVANAFGKRARLSLRKKGEINEALKLFSDYSLVEILQLWNAEDIFSDGYYSDFLGALSSRAGSDYLSCERIMYNSSKGTPMLTWIAITAPRIDQLSMTVAEAIIRGIENITKQFFHVNRSGRIVKYENGSCQQTLNLKSANVKFLESIQRRLAASSGNGLCIYKHKDPAKQKRVRKISRQSRKNNMKRRK